MKRKEKVFWDDAWIFNDWGFELLVQVSENYRPCPYYGKYGFHCGNKIYLKRKKDDVFYLSHECIAVNRSIYLEGPKKLLKYIWNMRATLGHHYLKQKVEEVRASGGVVYTQPDYAEFNKHLEIEAAKKRAEKNETERLRKRLKEIRKSNPESLATGYFDYRV